MGSPFAYNSSEEYFIDLLGGNDQLRLSLDAGASVAEIMAGWETEQADFARRD